MSIKKFTHYIVWPGIALLAVLATMSISSRASMSPATWVYDRIIGVSDDAWIALHVERHVKSAFEYRTSSEIRIVSVLNGCVQNRVSLGEITSIDENATGKWLENQISRGDSSNLAFMPSMTPVIPADWRELLNIKNGAVVLTGDGKKISIVASAAVLKWAALQGVNVKSDANIKIASVFQSTNSLRGSNWVYLEIETTYRDADIDYSRFVLPLKIGDRSSGTTDPAKLLSIQPQPSGC